MFNEDIYYNSLNTTYLGKNIYIYNEVTSTNDILLNENFPHGSVVIASKQTKGRGRSGRCWIDNDSSLIFSILLNDLSKEMLLPFNIIAGFAVCDGISQYVPVKLKWPNDCTINNKKVCGMLLEVSFQGNSLSKIVFGAGINIFNENFPENIAYKATSIFLNTKEVIQKEIILSKTLNSMEQMLNNYKKGLLKIENIWQNYSANYRKKISIHINGEKKEMIEKGVLETGELIVQDIVTGNISHINVGEIGYDFNC